jgi:L,D-peptidoglycan transpeptidase YkuD (ErfK/YbiS/YcfS/YnhG family)
MIRRLAVFIGACLAVSCLVYLLKARDPVLDARQMVVCIAPDASSSEGSLQLFRRDDHGDWQPDSQPWPALFGRRGLAWGRGLHPPQPGPQKVEGDQKNPEGLFKIGLALGYAARLPNGSMNWPYHQVTDRDAWIDDPRLNELPFNQLYTLPPGVPYPSWWPAERLTLGDKAYQWMVFIEHNCNDPEPHAGSDIFFHIRRREHEHTLGCTTMALDRMEQLICWLDPTADPVLAELTRADYLRLWKAWKLPPPELAMKS